MRSLLWTLPALMIVAGCEGHAIDHLRPKEAILAPELRRYALDPAQSQCLHQGLSNRLSVLQLRLLARMAGAPTPASRNPTGLSMREFLWRSTRVKDPKVAIEVARAAETCGLTGATLTSAPQAPQTVQTAAAEPAAPLIAAPVGTAPVPVAPAAGKPLWVNLGAAVTGQTIALDAGTISGEAPYRQAWFRLSSPGQAGPSDRSYLLRIDCSARTINSMAFRRYDPSGLVVDNRDYGATGEGAAPIEGGTVMEIAYLALCT